MAPATATPLFFCIFSLLFLLGHAQPPSSSSPSPSTTPSNSALPGFDLWTYLPPDWSAICDVDYDVDPDVNATLTCRPTEFDLVLWRLADLRRALNETLVDSLKLEVAADFQCENGGVISLPYPMRSPGLVKLTVSNCLLLDKYADFDTEAELLGDWLREQDLRNCVWLNDPEVLDRVLHNSANVSSHYNCGQDSTLVTYIYRNISDRNLPTQCDTLYPAALSAMNLTYPTDFGILFDDDELFEVFMKHAADVGGKLEQCVQELAVSREEIKELMSQMQDGSTPPPPPAPVQTEPPAVEASSTTEHPNMDVLRTLRLLRRMKNACRFEHLQIYDESFLPIMSVNYFEEMVENTVFPELRILNFSHTGLLDVPRQIREWRVYFEFAKMEVIDLSNSMIESIGRFQPQLNDKGVTTTLNLQNNRISTISLDMIEHWALVPDFFVDVRHNPFHCTCDMKDLINSFQNDTKWTSPPMTYYKQQLSVMECATPPDLAGRTINSLDVGDLGCPVIVAAGTDFRPVIAGLSVVVVILLVLLAVAIRYRREVRILMYTRMHIIVPCGSPKQPSAYAAEKTFDAFVAYAHQDSEWVLGSLVQRLEESSHSKGHRPCKLCIHQRDFVVGKPIIDNIIESIAASRHTIVILSKHFVRSSWAMEELKQAFHQSLEERTRHLLLVELEDLPKAEMGPTLTRCRKTFTYINVSDTFFWDKLQYSIQIGDLNSKKAAKKGLQMEKPDLGVDKDYENLGYMYDSVDLKKNVDMETGELAEGSPRDSDFNKTALFSESMRSISVDSGVSTSTTTTLDMCVTP